MPIELGESGLPIAVSTPTAAKMLDCGKSTIFILLKSGQLESFKIGKRGRRITVASIQAFLQKGLTTTPYHTHNPKQNLPPRRQPLSAG